MISVCLFLEFDRTFFIIQYIYYMIKLFSGLGLPSYAEAIQLAARESPIPSAPELQLEPDSAPAAVSRIYGITYM